MSESGGEPIQVLHVDDDPDLAEVVALHLERTHDDIEVVTETSARDGLDHLAGDSAIECVVSDHDMPGMHGLDFLRAVRDRYDDLPFILFTGKGSEEIASEAISAGVTEYLQKETGSDQYAVLANRIERAVAERRAREALKESERMFSTLIRNLPGMVYRCENEPDWPMVYVSEGCRELTGYAAAEIESGDVVWGEDILHPEETDRVWSVVQEALDAGESFELTYRIETADDEVRWVWERGSAIYEDGELAFLEGFITDITERKRREEQLREERAFTESALNALDDAFFVLDLETRRFSRWNEELGSGLGYDETDLSEMQARDLIADEHVERLVDGVQEALETGSMSVEADVIAADGERFPVEIRGAPMYGEDADLIGLGAVARDISDRKERERTLEQYRELVENVGDPMYVLDADGRYVMVNQAMEEISGLSREEFIGTKPTKFMYESDYQRGTEVLFDVMESSDERWGSFELVPKVGDAAGRTWENKVAPLTDEDETYRGAVGVIRDVSRRKERERELEEYRTLVENVGDPMYILDTDGTIRMVNDAMVSHLGHDREEVVGKTPLAFMPPEDVERGTEIITELITEEAEDAWRTWEMDAVQADGTYSRTENRTAVIYEDGEYAGSVGVIRDIQDRVERERELERYETIIQAVGDPVYALDEDGVFTFVNDALAEMTGYDADELLGDHISTVITDEDAVDGREYIRDLLDDPDRRAAKYEISIVTRDGDEIPSELHLALLPVEDEFRGTAGIIRDIEERKQREERLEEFASVVSHDLRSPLNVIMGRLQLARSQDDPSHLDRMADAADRMDKLIDDLLTLARKGQTVGEFDTVDLEAVAEEAWRTADPDQVTLTYEDPGTVEADPARLQELLENLFRNVAEHAVDGEDDEVEVRIGPLEDGFFVADDGPGIPEADREAVFDHGYTTSDDGTGFGLSIVQRIAEAHDWTISVTEGHDGGARFEIRS